VFGMSKAAKAGSSMANGYRPQASGEARQPYQWPVRSAAMPVRVMPTPMHGSTAPNRALATVKSVQTVNSATTVSAQPRPASGRPTRIASQNGSAGPRSVSFIVAVAILAVVDFVALPLAWAALVAFIVRGYLRTFFFPLFTEDYRSVWRRRLRGISARGTVIDWTSALIGPTGRHPLPPGGPWLSRPTRSHVRHVAGAWQSSNWSFVDYQLMALIYIGWLVYRVGGLTRPERADTLS
jgi:hypothetical protein